VDGRGRADAEDARAREDKDNCNRAEAEADPGSDVKLRRGMNEDARPDRIRKTLYRPFVKRSIYDSALLIDERGPWDLVFPQHAAANVVVGLLAGNRQPFSVVATDEIPNFNLYSADSTAYLPRRRIEAGLWIDNITGCVYAGNLVGIGLAHAQPPTGGQR
jgi:predicted helicase